LILCDLSFCIKYKLESGLRKFETLHLRMSYISCVNKTLCLIVESRRTFKHIWLLPTQKAQTKNQKSLNFANAQ